MTGPAVLELSPEFVIVKASSVDVFVIVNTPVTLPFPVPVNALIVGFVNVLFVSVLVPLSTNAFIDCCVANFTALLDDISSSSLIPVTVAPSLAMFKDVVVVNAPVTSVPAFNLILPVPLGSSVKSAFDGAIIVDPLNEKSPTETVPNDSTPEPLVCNTWFAEPSDDGKVYAQDIFTFPDPEVVSSKSALEGALISDPVTPMSPRVLRVSL